MQLGGGVVLIGPGQRQAPTLCAILNHAILTRISDLNITEVDGKWLFNFISSVFKNPDENITSLKILSKLGIRIHDQLGQYHYKAFIDKFNLLLGTLKDQGLLVQKENSHDTLGIKEKSYKIA